MMAKRRKKKAGAKKRPMAAATSASFVQTAERAVISQSTKMLNAANRQYKKLVRQAAKATNDRNKRKYLAAALSAVAIAGVVANDLNKRLDARPAATARKKKRL
jgi:hypothetical protein